MIATKLLESKLKEHPSPYLTDAELIVLLDGSPDSRYSKVKRLTEQGKLLHIRRGLYCLTDKVSYTTKPHPYELAQYIYGPSYVSLESALSFHGLIPEAVYTTTSVTTRRSKDFHTPVGLFSYLHLPLENFFIEVELINENNSKFFMAKPWKAIFDYVFCYKKNIDSLDMLLESLRIESHTLPILGRQEIQLFEDYYQSKRVDRFLKTI